MQTSFGSQMAANYNNLNTKMVFFIYDNRTATS